MPLGVNLSTFADGGLPPPQRTGMSLRMFFEASKILWELVAPANVLVVALVAGSALLWTRRRRAGRWIVTACALLAVAVATVPAGRWMVAVLEDRFPVPSELPSRVDGIIVLGGGTVLPRISSARKQTVAGGAVARVLRAAELAERYPRARVLFTAGSGSLRTPELKEADHVAPLMADLGVGPDRLLLENRSRNTHENAAFGRDVAAPAAGETWILVTSAFHMPRAVGCFRAVGWTVVAYPVGFLTEGRDQSMALGFDLQAGLRWLSLGLHEWLGLVAYRLAGHTDALLPGPAR